MLVLAGPGAGKTEVLTHRIAYLVTNRDQKPAEILAVTFSRKAAYDMAERLKDFQGLEKAKPRISTLHAEALRILREMKKDGKFLLEEDEALELMIDAAQDLRLYIGAREVTGLGQEIALLKAKNILPNEIKDIDNHTKMLKKFYERYEELLAFNQATPIDGLVMKVVRVLHATGFNRQYNIRHLLVDEYQDVNQAEFQFIKLLAEDAESLFAVGDDDQSIYGWRGTDPNIIRSFQRDFEKTQIEILDESHRCTEHILLGAQAIVSKDPNCIQKPLRSAKGEGSLIHLLLSKSWTVEGLWIAEWIRDHVSKNLFEARNIAILCKTPKFVEFLAGELRRVGIEVSYWRSGGLLADKNVRDIMAHIRLLTDREDNLALRRCMSTPTCQGVGRIGLLRLRKIAEKNSCSLWKVVTNAIRYRELKRWQDQLIAFASKIKQLDLKSAEANVDQTIQLIARQIGVSESQSVEKLRRFAQALPPDADLDYFLSEVRSRKLDLAGGQPEPEEQTNAVNVMSMHSAKGLNFDVVFLLGMDEGILPDSTREENEQRRLCYVAMTRARKELFLCHARLRTGPAARGWSIYHPSRFLNDIPKKHIEVIRLV